MAGHTSIKAFEAARAAGRPHAWMLLQDARACLCCLERVPSDMAAAPPQAVIMAAAELASEIEQAALRGGRTVHELPPLDPAWAEDYRETIARFAL